MALKEMKADMEIGTGCEGRLGVRNCRQTGVDRD